MFIFYNMLGTGGLSNLLVVLLISGNEIGFEMIEDVKFLSCLCIMLENGSP